MLLTGAACAQESSALIGLINDYRSAPRRCEGKVTAAVSPLAPDPALAGIRITAGGQLPEALKAHGYQAAQAQAITVTGPGSASDALRFMRERYCRALLNPRYAEIGISRDADTWRIVLAQPLLSPDLGDWHEAGREILRLANAARAEPRNCGGTRLGKAPPLEWSAELAAAALVHSRDMADRNYFRHIGSDGSQAGARATREGYVWRRVGENIAAGQGSPGQVLAGWLSSPEHCANIMSRHFTEMGAAFAVNPDSDTMIYWTQVFGTPR